MATIKSSSTTPTTSDSNPSSSSIIIKNATTISTSSAIKSSTNNSSSSSNIKPQTRLDLSVNPSDGTLLTAPLSLIINNATDTLYNDLHFMTNDILTLIIPSTTNSKKSDPLQQPSSSADHKDDYDHSNSSNKNGNLSTTSFTTKQESMSNMSFQQRRHILASTLAKHIKSISHISALVASNLFTSGSTSIQSIPSHNNTQSSSSHPIQQPNLFTISQTPTENELSSITIITSQALNHIRTSWVNADEAQDALYFHHDTLWKVRSHPHDVKGALDVIRKGEWVDLSNDIRLLDVGAGAGDGDSNNNGGYEESEQGKWDIHETRERLKCVVRRKLILGEVGMFHSSLSTTSTSKNNQQFWWNIILEQNGAVVRLFHGRGCKQSNKNIIYPIEARVTVLSEQQYPNNNNNSSQISSHLSPTPWTLLSMRLHTNVKTGESNHQLELNQEQMYRFHKLCEIAMNQEENRVNQLNNNGSIDDKNESNGGIIIARPLEKLLDMCHVFSLSWQLEILSSQADALRKGTWKSLNTSGNGGGGISVSHVHFFDDHNNNTNQTNNKNDIRGCDKPIGVMAIHFWEVDDRNGRPSIGKLTSAVDNNDTVEFISKSKSYLPSSDRNHNKRLTLEIIAVPRVGLEVSISGGKSVMKRLQTLSKDETNSNSSSHLKRNVDKLLASVQDPFQLSASDALLSAAVICAEHKCHAAVSALLRLGKVGQSQNTSLSRGSLKEFPPWLYLSVECGSISVGVSVAYYGKEDKARPPVILFRLACDSRTGCFVPTFPQSATLLRQLVCNDPNASEIQVLRQAKVISNQNPSGSSNQRGSIAAASRSGKELSGRMIRDAFEGLTRSMDILGRRVGVGGDWDDLDKTPSYSLREKSIIQSCNDVMSSLMPCSGIVAVYSIAATAAAIASGVSPQPDM